VIVVTARVMCVMFQKVGFPILERASDPNPESPCGTNSVWGLHTVSTLSLNYDTVHYI
jgi:hypothetical protein